MRPKLLTAIICKCGHWLGLKGARLPPICPCCGGQTYLKVNLANNGGKDLVYHCTNEACGVVQHFPRKPDITRCSNCLTRGSLRPGEGY